MVILLVVLFVLFFLFFVVVVVVVVVVVIITKAPELTTRLMEENLLISGADFYDLLLIFVGN
jgi:hypothetical protein